QLARRVQPGVPFGIGRRAPVRLVALADRGPRAAGPSISGHCLVVHPPSFAYPQCARVSQLRPSFPATPRSHPLPLLSSEPDGVRGLPPRGTQPSTLLNVYVRGASRPREGIRRRIMAGFGWRAPPAPRLARPERMIVFSIVLGPV